MVKKNFLAVLWVLLMTVLISGAARAEENSTADSGAVEQAPTVPESTATRVVVTYFHGDVRCATCMKLEAYSKEAVETAFAPELADSSLVWRTVNYDQDDNRHYIDDYQLYTKALILSRMEGDEETGWRNLDKIWELVGDQEKYTAYVQEEIRKFLADDGSDE